MAIEKQTFWDPYLGGTIEIQSPGLRAGKGWAHKPVYYKGQVEEINVDSSGALTVVSHTIVTTEKVKPGKEGRTTVINLHDIKEQSLPKKMLFNGHTEDRLYGSATVYLAEPGNLAVSQNGKAVEPEPIPEPEPVVRQYKDKAWETDFRFLALLRHGPYTGLHNRENSLTLEGREKIREVAEHLKESTQVAEGKTIVLSSTSRRAFETALLIADKLECNVERYKCIGDESGDYYSYEEVLQTISDVHSRNNGREKYTTIIVVSHYPFCASAHKRIVFNLFAEACEPPEINYSPGTGMLVDLADFKHQAIKV